MGFKLTFKVLMCDFIPDGKTKQIAQFWQ